MKQTIQQLGIPHDYGNSHIFSWTLGGADPNTAADSGAFGVGFTQVPWRAVATPQGFHHEKLGKLIMVMIFHHG